MRRTLAAAVIVALFMASGCQDQQARDQNARLQAELELMKSQRSGGGNDDLIKAMLLNQKGGDSESLERKLTSNWEDTRSGLDDIKKQISESDRANTKRIDDLETRLKKVSDLEGTINTLKTMIETMESKVKNVDPNEVLNAHRDLINKEADLRLEKQAREAALAEVEALKKQLADTTALLEATKAEMIGLAGEDISKHPAYRDLQDKNRALESDKKRLEADLASVKLMYDTLAEQLRRGSNPVPDVPAPKLDNYDFSGSVTSVTRGARADGPSYLLVGNIRGTVPAVGTEMTVLDSKGGIVCRVKVIRLYHFNDKDDMPVEEVGCQTVDESTTKPVAKNDTVVWVKEGKDDAAKGASKDGTEPPKAAGGGN